MKTESRSPLPDRQTPQTARKVTKVPPGALRDVLLDILAPRRDGTSLAEIERLVRERLPTVAPSSVRSYLNAHTDDLFERVSRGKYRLAGTHYPDLPDMSLVRSVEVGQARLFHCDSFDWLRSRAPNSVHAVVTDPPYGLVEYTDTQKAKLRSGKGGIWRIPPAFDGVKRAALPRFTTLTDEDHARMRAFFTELAVLLHRVLVPGANVLVATNPLLTHHVAGALVAGGLEMRGQITRLVMTMRGGDRPKGAHDEFRDVSVLPRSQHEPWIVLRKGLDGTAAENLRKWHTGGFRRISDTQPFGDVIRSSPTRGKEKKIAPHPSLKPQALMRQLVRGALPLGRGVVLDPFAGSGATLAAANAVGYESLGMELDAEFFDLAADAIPALSTLTVKPADDA